MMVHYFTDSNTDSLCTLSLCLRKIGIHHKVNERVLLTAEVALVDGLVTHEAVVGVEIVLVSSSGSQSRFFV